MITRSDIAAHLERTAKVGFLLGSTSYTPRRGAFTQTTTSDGAFELYADMGAAPWPEHITGKQGAGGTDARTGAPKIGSLAEGGAVTILGGEERSMMVYNDGWDITVGIWHDAINDARIGSLETWARTMGTRFEQHKDFLAFDYLNQGDATTVYGPGYDGLSLFNANHKDTGAVYQTVQSNALSTALSFTNYKAARIAASKFKDGRGQPTGYFYDHLIVPVDLEEEATQITRNPSKPSTGDRDINPYQGSSQTVAPGGWLDTTFWALACTSLPQKPIILQERQAPTLLVWDDHTMGGGVRYFKWYARYTPAAGDWRLIIRGNT